MRWSFPIGRLFGVPVRIHYTFPLFLLYVGGRTYFQEHDWGATLEMAFLSVLLFGCVLLHEFGHVLAARHFGYGTRDVTLLPIGGVARLDQVPEDPRQEIWVAIAGPLVNVAIALILLPLVGLKLLLSADGFWDVIWDSPMAALLVSNLAIACFNLLPAFPMDGGRVLRALLARRLDYVRATWIATRLGRVMAVLFCVLSFWGYPHLALVGIVVWVIAGRENAMVASQAQ
ncbi:MAG TPA: site-2 protease family protein [Candidatus Limnocylindria bacterium]|nr:site-2 protease family protein [Candidatus Limnocylindria bacterium]